MPSVRVKIAIYIIYLAFYFGVCVFICNELGDDEYDGLGDGGSHAH